MPDYDLIRIHPRDDTFYVSQNRTVLATGRDGFIGDHPQHGLFIHETRMLSRYRYLLNGKSPTPVGISNIQQHSWLGYYISPPPSIQGGGQNNHAGQGSPDEAQHSIELRISRFVGDGFHEDLDITNYTQQSINFSLILELDGDFADLEETGGNRLQRGKLKRKWEQVEAGKWLLSFSYAAQHNYEQQGEKGTATVERILDVEIEHADSAPSFKGKKISFDIALAPEGKWHACLNFIATVDGVPLILNYRCRSFYRSDNAWDQGRSRFLSESSDFESRDSSFLSNTVVTALRQAKADIAALRLFDLDQHQRAWTVAAGLPVYVALFGRDTLTTAMQSALLTTELMPGSLQVLAKQQGREMNDWRDEEPGRMLHEAHTGPLEVLNFNPRMRSYSSVTTSGFYPVVVAELWHWTGDKELVQPFLEPALRALEWADRYSDIDGDGFYEYKTKSIQGVQNQGWKDSGDAVVDENGSQITPPIATCEEQAFVYFAKWMLSEVLLWFDRKEESARLFNQASELKKRFNQAFWMDEEQYYAMGLDSNKRQIRSIASNPGHCIASGIVEQQYLEPTILRMFAPDLFSGWGIRTLSSDHPAYNPHSYHRGSIWPVEQGSFALGLMRYGLPEPLHRLTRAQFEAAALFSFCRLPELFSGHPRDQQHPFPAIYPRANWPQAWSASAIFSFVQAILGLYPYAPLNLLLIDPHLPEWLPELTVKELRVGKARTNIRFYRKPDGNTTYQILETTGDLHILRQASPWSMTATLPERAKDILISLIS